MFQSVLLSSVFKPFGVDNIYSRRESKIELYHNQITKAQGVFSLRSLVSTAGLHLIAKNIEAPTTVLDFPTLKRFRKELKKGYDIVGIGAILPNFQKVKRMVEDVRELSPRSTIVLGGFCANAPDIEKVMDVDHVCVGDGVTFMRDLLGLPAEFKLKHPDVFTDTREVLGVPIFGAKNAMIIVGLGCSYGCDFCSPSHFFGKRHVKFYKTGKELYQEMLNMAKRFGRSWISLVGDDNFFLDLKRAEELRQCIVEGGKFWKLFLFGSADRIKKFGIEKLAEMGVDTIWIGREAKAGYKKTEGVNLKDLIADLRFYGIKTILSSVLLMDQHTKDNINEDIDDHLDCLPTFSQFSHYSPFPGTPLYDRMNEEGKILTSIPYEEWHAFKQPWFIHPEFNLKEAEDIQEQAYQRDFHELGPSLMRYAEIEYEGWKNLKDSASPYLRAKAEHIASRMRQYKIMLTAMEHLAPTDKMRDIIREVRTRVESSFGKPDALEKAAALGMFMAGRFREFRARHWNDSIQPRTRVERYNQ